MLKKGAKPPKQVKKSVSLAEAKAKKGGVVKSNKMLGERTFSKDYRKAKR